MKPLFASVMVILCATGALTDVDAQVMEPRTYANAPIGLNFLLAGYGYLSGDVLLDPALPISGLEVTAHTTVVGYTRVIDVFGQSGTVAVLTPYAWLEASGEVAGEPASVDRSGLTDLVVRLSANLCGAPALSLAEFQTYRRGTIVGASLVITAPVGQYDREHLINIGTNRWSFRPEIGVSRAFGDWTIEVAAGVTLYTDNDEFLGDNKREQAPLYGLQGHLIYNVNPRLWAAVDATFYSGGETSLNGEADNDEQQSSRWGGTLAYSLSRQHSLKLYFNTGLTARSGGDFTTAGLAWQYRWGAGL